MKLADRACPSSGVLKPIQTELLPNKTNVKFTWTYDRDPEDKGFSFKVGRSSRIHIYNVTTRSNEYTIPDLGMYIFGGLYISMSKQLNFLRL